jgi:hypothetical protein
MDAVRATKGNEDRVIMLPDPFFDGIRVCTRQGIGRIDLSMTAGPIFCVQFFHTL